MRIPPSHGVGFWQVIPPQGLVIKILVGNRALVGKVLPRSAKGAFPLLGSALRHPVPHLPTVMTYYILALCWRVAKAATLVAGAKLAFVPDCQPDWPYSDHTRDRSV